MLVMGVTGLVTRGFLYGLSSTRVQGLDGFLKLLDERSNVDGRERGLITGRLVSSQFRLFTGTGTGTDSLEPSLKPR